MSLKTLKILQSVVGVCVAGIVVCLAMTFLTAAKRRHPAPPVNPATIPTPATLGGR